MKPGSTPSGFDSWGKTDFNGIYQAPDPREYYRVLYGFDYVIPDLAKGIFSSIADYCRSIHDRPLRIVDLGCSYGINAALSTYPLDLQRLAQRYAAPEMHALDAAQLIALDKHYFRAWPRRTDATFVGLDTSAPAVSYAKEVGLLAAGVTTDLERTAPDAADRTALRDADLIISTGCVGYVSERTFAHILACQEKGSAPVVASLVLRMFPYDAVADELARHGLVTEKLEGVTFVQRRFSSADEFDAAIETLRGLGIDTADKEADGLMHAELFVSRPAELIEEMPLGQLVSVTSGVNRRYGQRFRRIGEGRTTLMH